MFDIFFGWRKASKCKKLIKRVQCRLKLLKNKKHTIVKQLRDDVAQLITLGRDESAFNRVEQLVKDESLMVAYEILEHFCEFISVHLSYIRRNKDCPNDINEAVSSLIFASARCGELPELPAIRKLFEERYGQKFAAGALESYPGNLVNREIKEKLSITSVSEDVKHRLVDEIVRDHSPRPQLLALEYPTELQQQVEKNSGYQEMDGNSPNCHGNIKGSKMQISDVDESEGKSIYVDPSSASKGLFTRPSLSHSQQNLDIFTASVNSSIVQQSSPDVLESPVRKKAEKVRSFHQMGFPLEASGGSSADTESESTARTLKTYLKNKEKRMKAVSSSESLLQFSEETVVYLDDIEEFLSSTAKGDFQDQRLFKFKSLSLPKRGKVVDGFDGGYMDCSEPQSENSGSITSKKSRNAYEKRSRRRSLSYENSSMKDTDHETYYEKPPKSSLSNKHRSHSHRKLQKNTTGEESEQSVYAQKRLKKPCFPLSGSKFHLKNCSFCSLKRPCYSCTADNKHELEVSLSKRKRDYKKLGQFPNSDLEEDLGDNFCCCQYSWNGGSNDEIEWTKMEETSTLPQNHLRRISYDYGSSVYDVFTWPSKQRERIWTVEISESHGSHTYSNRYSPNVTVSEARKETLTSYLRAMTMPQERPKNSHSNGILRSSSCNFPYPNHVHPKLPDYDDIAAKFIALKKEYLQNQQ